MGERLTCTLHLGDLPERTKHPGDLVVGVALGRERRLVPPGLTLDPPGDLDELGFAARQDAAQGRLQLVYPRLGLPGLTVRPTDHLSGTSSAQALGGRVQVAAPQLGVVGDDRVSRAVEDPPQLGLKEAGLDVRGTQGLSRPLVLPLRAHPPGDVPGDPERADDLPVPATERELAGRYPGVLTVRPALPLLVVEQGFTGGDDPDLVRAGRVRMPCLEQVVVGHPDQVRLGAPVQSGTPGTHPQKPALQVLEVDDLVRAVQKVAHVHPVGRRTEHRIRVVGWWAVHARSPPPDVALAQLSRRVSERSAPDSPPAGGCADNH